MNPQKLFEHITSELLFTTARSGGKGGQHVNKVETKVVLKWLFMESKMLEEELKQKIKQYKHHYIKTDCVVISSEKTRSQLKNKVDTETKLLAFLQEVLKVEKTRKPTKVPKAVMAKRLKSKKEKGVVKSNRKKIDPKDF